MKKLRKLIVKLRVALGRKLLGNKFIIQNTPDSALKSGLHPYIVSETERLNNEYSVYNHKNNYDYNRFLTLKLILDIVRELPKGDYAEVGVWRGNSTRLIWQNMAESAALYGFDTFEGFDERDSALELATSRINVRVGAYGNTSMEEVRNLILEDSDRDSSRLHLVQGYFPDSLSEVQNIGGATWRFVHLDCDLYKPIRDGLQFFWKKLVPGGYIVVHDYFSAYAGSKAAVDEFCKKNKLRIFPVCDKAGSVVLAKAG